MCKTRFWGFYRSKLDFISQKCILWSKVLTRRRYTPLCHQKTRISLKKHDDAWRQPRFFVFLGRKNPHFWSPGDQCWVKTNGDTVKHYFTVVYHGYCVRGRLQTQKAPNFRYFSGFSRICDVFLVPKYHFHGRLETSVASKPKEVL